MVEQMKPLRPVWGAEEANAASLGLAVRLGFVPVDELIVFIRRAINGESCAKISGSRSARAGGRR